jgi:hypothetical protein
MARNRDPRQARFLTWASLRWVWRHRAWTPWYAVRYWRFFSWKLRNPHVVTEGFIFMGKNVELYARKGYGRLVIGRWVHVGNGNAIRCHEGQPADRRQVRLRQGQHGQLLPRHRVRRVHAGRGLGLHLRLRPCLQRRPRADQGPGHHQGARADRSRRLDRAEGVDPARGDRRPRVGHRVARARQPRRPGVLGGRRRTGAGDPQPPDDYRAEEAKRAALADIARKVDAAAQPVIDAKAAKERA